MATRFYLVPIETLIFQGETWRVPKYFRQKSTNPIYVGVAPMIMFGNEPTGLVAANVDAAQHAAIVAQADVTSIPANLDAQLGANLSTVQAQLEALNLPADMLTATNTYRQVLRGVVAILHVASRFYAVRGTQPDGGRLFPVSVTLATTLGELSASVRADLQQAAVELGYDYSGLTLASSIRDVLKKLASQPVPFGLLDVTV